jgi:hypothetical protein
MNTGSLDHVPFRALPASDNIISKRTPIPRAKRIKEYAAAFKCIIRSKL